MNPRSTNTGRRLLPLLLPLALLASACGQKSGVAGSDAVATLPPEAPATQPPATQPAGTAAPGSVPAASTAPGATPGPTEPAAVTTVPVAEGPFEPGDNDTAGVSDTEIVIGIHAPVTGASPIPQTSFDVGKDIYWKFLAESAPEQLFGRNVRVVFRDDEFNPQHAVQVCREMVEQDGAFMLVGGGGADQITACAQYANENGIPYVSAGVNETGLADLETYFASTLTYAEQAPMLIDRIAAEGLTEIGLVVSDTPSFDDAMEAITAAAEEAGITVAYETRINKTATEPEQLAVVQELKNSGVQGVILLSSPVVFIGLANQGLNQGFTPLWLGPGVTSGLNAVTNFGCPAVETGEFFSPTPGLDVIDQLDPDFNPAYVQFGGGAAADDIGLQLWALNKALALMFEATGPELGRAAFMNALVTAPGFDNEIYSAVQFTPDDHFGGTGAALLAADCAVKQFTTAEQFVTAGLSVGDFVQRRAGLLIGLGLAAVLIAVLVIAGEKQSIVIGTVTGSAYGLVALGLVLIYKSSGVFNFAQGEFGTVALCTLYLLHSNDIAYGFAVIGALLVSVLFGFLTERIIIRPLFEAPRVTLLVATAGVALLAIAVQQWLFDNQGRPIAKAFPTVDRLTVLGVQISDQRLSLIVVLAVLAVVLGVFFTRTNLGLAIIGASQEPTATELVGISVRRLSTFTWVLAALLGGLAAVIAVPDTGQFTPGVMTGAYLIPAFTAAVLGGMTSLPGAFLGGVLVGIIQSVATSAEVFQDIPGTPSTLIVFLVLLGVLVIRPQGLLGKSG